MKGADALHAFFASLPENLERNVLRPALKAGAEVYAEGARELCRDPEVEATIGTTSRSEPGLVTAKVQTKGEGAFKAPWLENGTDAHFITVDDSQREGQTVARINDLDRKARKEGRDGPGPSLKINGKFVGGTVFHPGAKPYPFMRPSVDTRTDAAIGAIAAHIAKKTTAAGVQTPDPEGETE
jgi:hypothetical protein